MASSSSSIDPKPQNPTPNPPTPTLNPTNPTPTPKTLTPSPQIHKFPQKSSSQPSSYPYSSSSNRNYGPKPSSSSYRPHSTEQFVRNGGGQFPNQVRNFGVSPQSMRPPPASQFGARFPGSSGSGGGGGGPIRSSPVVANHNHNHNHKSTPYQSPATGNGYRDSRETNRDDSVVTIHHRKVRLSDGGSLYALCRSWVRNGLPKETQPPLGEGLKLLPRPLPISVANGGLPEKSGSDDEDEEKEEEVSSVENMSARELLHLHVKHAKKTRARLRKERLQKIDRFKQRLALLLPPPEEQVRERDASETF